MQIYYHKKLCMKKMILLFAVVAAFSVTGYSQDLLKQATSAATSAAGGGFDVKSLTSSILGKLTPSLGLSDKQKPGVTDIISASLQANIKCSGAYLFAISKASSI